MQAAFARERVDPVRVEPRPRQDRRVGDVAVDEDPPRALHAAVDEHDQRPVAAEVHALVGFVLEHALVGDEELLRETERRLGRVERFAAQRMRGRREVELEPRPEDLGGAPEFLGQLEAPRVADGDDIDGRERVADDARRLDGVAGQRLVEPFADLSGAGFRRIGRPGIERRKTERQGHGRPRL